jgi:hypothetical protein
MGALAKVVRIGSALGALAWGALASAAPAVAAPPGVVSVTGGLTPGTLSVTYEESGVDPDILNLFVLPAAANPADCSFGAFFTATGGTNAFRTVYPLTGSPMAVGSGPTWAGGEFTIVPGEEYVVCLSDGSSGFGSPVVGTATPASPAGAGEATPPPSWWQSYGRLAAGDSCEAGWAPSWAAWMNSGSGGWVCNREQYWNPAISAWSFR